MARIAPLDTKQKSKFEKDPLKFVEKTLGKMRTIMVAGGKGGSGQFFEEVARSKPLQQVGEKIHDSRGTIETLAFAGTGRRQRREGGKPDLAASFFRNAPNVRDPGDKISTQELSAEMGRLLVVDRIAEQAQTIARRENTLGATLGSLGKFMLFREGSGVSEKDLAGLNESEQENLIRKGLERVDSLVIGLVDQKNEGDRARFADFKKGSPVLRDRAAESLAGFQLNAEGDPEADSLLRRVERNAFGHRGSIRTSSAGIPRRKSGRSLSSARTSQLGQQIGPKDAPKGNLFSGPSGLLENNILGTGGELGNR
jgi:hypothetical protein